MDNSSKWVELDENWFKLKDEFRYFYDVPPLLDKKNIEIVRSKRDKRIFISKKPKRDEKREKCLIEIFNELLVHKLSKIFSIVSTETFVGKINDEIRVFSELRGTRKIQDFDKFLRNFDEFDKLIVFHQWIYHQDNKSDNYIVTKEGDFYPIDYGNALNGHNGSHFLEVGQALFEEPCPVTVESYQLKYKIHDIEIIKKLILEIQNFPDLKIKNIIDETLGNILKYSKNSEEYKIILNDSSIVNILLVKRRDKLYFILEECKKLNLI